MKLLSGAPFVLLLNLALCVPTLLQASSIQELPKTPPPAPVALWQSDKAEHVYGWPEIKHNKKGTLSLSADELAFSGKSGNATIPRSAITAVSAGNQRVEIWGIGGRILRTAIPNGGGIVAAGVMHHRIDMLTVEYNDLRGGSHAAVFFLPASEAERALHNFAFVPPPAPKHEVTACHGDFVDAKSVLVSTPDWEHAQVPAAYRALVYEHLVDRLQHTKEVGHVYREGETLGQKGCPQYTVHVAIAAFKEGSSVKRAYMGPAGMFVGTTQMKFDVTYSDATGELNSTEQISATIRGESESTNVADHVAKNVAKHYEKALKNAENNKAANKTAHPVS